MATTIFEYPPPEGGSASVSTVQGEGTAGTPTGGLLTIQGDPAGTPIPISGSITASNASIGATGSAVPASATYIAGSNGGTLIGAVADSSGRQIVAGAGVAGTPAGGVVSVQGVASGTVLPANVTQFGSSAVVTGTGTGGSGIPRVTVSSDSTIGLVAGTAIIGKVSIDQTTPGTTNGVQVNAALPAGSNIIGNVRIDQTTPGTTNGVQVNAALPAGSNSIGNIGTVSTVTGVTTVSTVTSVTNVAAQATWTTTTAAFQAEGSIAFGSLTNAYQTVFTPSAATKVLQMRNNTNAAVSVSFDAGTTLNYVLDAGDAVSLDLLANGLVMSTTAIQAKYTVGAPTSGSFRINGGH